MRTMVLALFFREVAEKLCLVGRQIRIRNGLFLLLVVGLLFNGPTEHNTTKTQHSNHGILETTNGTRFHMFTESKLGKDDIIFPKDVSSLNPNHFSPSEHFSCQDGKLVVNHIGYCPRSISVVSIMQCEAMEGQKLHNHDDSKGSKTCLPESIDTCHELQSFLETFLSTTLLVCPNTRQPEHTCEINQGDSHLKTETSKDESQQFVVETFVSSGGFRDNSEWSHLQVLLTYEFMLNHFICSLILVLVLGGMVFCLMERRPSIRNWVLILVSTLGFILKSINGPHPTLFPYDFATFVYDLARLFMFLALIFEHTQWELSYLFAGTSYALVHLLLLDYTFSLISSGYVCVLVAVLFFFILFAALSGFTSNRDN